VITADGRAKTLVWIVLTVFIYFCLSQHLGQIVLVSLYIYIYIYIYKYTVYTHRRLSLNTRIAHREIRESMHADKITKVHLLVYLIKVVSHEN
jgi:Ca2+/Na+ antiporter